MTDTELLELMNKVATGDVLPAEAAIKIVRANMGSKDAKIVVQKTPVVTSTGCHY